MNFSVGTPVKFKPGKVITYVSKIQRQKNYVFVKQDDSCVSLIKEIGNPSNTLSVYTNDLVRAESTAEAVARKIRELDTKFENRKELKNIKKE